MRVPYHAPLLGDMSNGGMSTEERTSSSLRIVGAPMLPKSEKTKALTACKSGNHKHTLPEDGFKKIFDKRGLLLLPVY